MHPVRTIAAAIALSLAPLGAALADDWQVQMARGTIEVQQDGVWHAVPRGAVIPDGTLIRTGMGAKARLVRGKEWLDLSPMTMILIHDRDGRQFTTVLQMAGTVEVEAEVRNVQHFSVQTPYLAAVVKGTHFTVSVKRGTSSLAVDRGLVQVENKQGDTYFVPKNETISVAKSGAVDASPGVRATAEAAKAAASETIGADNAAPEASQGAEKQAEAPGNSGNGNGNSGQGNNGNGQGNSGNGNSGNGNSGNGNSGNSGNGNSGNSGNGNNGNGNGNGLANNGNGASSSNGNSGSNNGIGANGSSNSGSNSGNGTNGNGNSGSSNGSSGSSSGSQGNGGGNPCNGNSGNSNGNGNGNASCRS